MLIEEPRLELVEHLVGLIGRLMKDGAPYRHNTRLFSDSAGHEGDGKKKK